MSGFKAGRVKITKINSSTDQIGLKRNGINYRIGRNSLLGKFVNKRTTGYNSAKLVFDTTNTIFRSLSISNFNNKFTNETIIRSSLSTLLLYKNDLNTSEYSRVFANVLNRVFKVFIKNTNVVDMPINIFLQHFEFIYGKDYLNTLNAVNTITLIRPNTTNTLDSKFNTTHKIFLYSPLINNETINVVINEDKMSKIHPHLDRINDIINNTRAQEYKLEFSTSIKSCTVKLNDNKTISDSINKYLNLDTISYEIQDIDKTYNLNTINSIGNFKISSKSGSVCCMIEHDIVSYIKNEFGSGRIYKIITDLENSFANIVPNTEKTVIANWNREIPDPTGNSISPDYKLVNGQLLPLKKSNDNQYGFKERAKFWKDVSLKAKNVFDEIYTQLGPEEKNEIKAIKDNIYIAELQSKEQDEFYKYTTETLSATIFEKNFSNVKYLIGAYNAVIIKNNNKTEFGGWDLKNIKSMRACFADHTHDLLDINIPNTQNVTDMSYMFYKATNFDIDLDDLKTENVRDMSYMFYKAHPFNKPLNKWNVSNVTNMSYMFYHTSNFNQPLNKWKVSNVTDMSYMFNSSGFGKNNKEYITDLGTWNIGKVINLKKAFSGPFFGKEGFELLKSLKPSCNSDVIKQIKLDKETNEDMINNPNQSTKQIIDIVHATSTETDNLTITLATQDITGFNDSHLVNLIVKIKEKWYNACFN
jgi:surface protein